MPDYRSERRSFGRDRQSPRKRFSLRKREKKCSLDVRCLGANVHHEDEEGLIALSWACLKGHYHACETLLTHGSDVNHEDANGRIPIDMASFYGDVQLVQLLIDHGSVIDHVDKNGMRALDRAIGCRNVAVVNCLLKKSVKLGKQRAASIKEIPLTNDSSCFRESRSILMLTSFFVARSVNMGVGSRKKRYDDDFNFEIDRWWSFSLQGKTSPSLWQNSLAVSPFQKNQYKDAAYRFSYALKKFPTDASDQFAGNFRSMKYNCLMNLAKCKRKLEVNDDLHVSLDRLTFF